MRARRTLNSPKNGERGRERMRERERAKRKKECKEIDTMKQERWQRKNEEKLGVRKSGKR